MTDFLLNQTGLEVAYEQGYRFVVRAECKDSSLVEFVAEDMGHAHTLTMNQIEKHHAKSVALYRILPDGKRNFVRFFDYRDAA